MLKNLTQGPDGSVSINLRLRSLYDSSIVKINGNKYLSIGANSSIKFRHSHKILRSNTAKCFSFRLHHTFRESSYESVTKSINAIVIAPAQNSYTNNFNSLTNPFIGTGFQIKTETGFANAAVHSPHPYNDNTNFTFTLTVPIIVASSNAYLAYKDIAIFEPVIQDQFLEMIIFGIM